MEGNGSRKKDHMIRLSDQSVFLLRQQQENAKKVLGTEISFDEVIKLHFEQPNIVVIQKEERKKKRYESVLGDMVEGFRLTDRKFMDGEG